MYNVQDYCVLYNSTVSSVICKGSHFTHTWKALTWPHNCIKRVNLPIKLA